jgi:uncharacterized membrane protein
MKSGRIESIDWLRGFVMILMALDHVRDYFHNYHGDPLGADAGPYIYATRWITHLCAPIFILLAGMAAGLVGKKKSKSDLSKFLFTRGLWLIFIEIAIVTFGWKFNFNNNPGIILQVIWAIGVCMVILSLLVYFSTRVNLILGIMIIFGHNLLGYMMPESSFPNPDSWWMAIEKMSFVKFVGINIFVGYPFLPWLGIMTLGYGMSPLFNLRPLERARIFGIMGISSLILFVVLRYSNFYGDTDVWVSGAGGIETLMNFMNVQKYPPSLLYTLVTLSIGMMMLWVTEQIKLPLHDQIITIGKVPFFYYILHIYLIHGMAVLTGILMGYSFSDMSNSFLDFTREFGFGLPVVYLVWIAVIFLLYPLCKWFAGVKERTKAWYLSYL